MTRVVECVPNFSEGRDAAVVASIVAAIGGTAGVSVLGSESDCDHNRSVVTFAGDPEDVAEGAYRGIAAAVAGIDLSRHEGVHPRIGAADVVPFVPVEGVTLEECAEMARSVGARVWEQLRVPVYLYEAAARVEERRRLENVRKGGLAFLREHIDQRPPDIGDPVLHPTAGAVILGARKFLIAFNINLETSDVGIAQAIARKIRASSGGMAHVKALGLMLESRGLAQVSMNLTDYEVTGLFEVFEAVRDEARARGVEIAGSELIGLMPQAALEVASAQFLKIENFTLDRVFERRLRGIVQAI